jgi:hypothetical protein
VGVLRLIPTDDLRICSNAAEVEVEARSMLYNFWQAAPNHVKDHELSEKLASELRCVCDCLFVCFLKKRIIFGQRQKESVFANV